MKKLLALVLAAAMVLSLVGCGNSTNNESSSSVEESSSAAEESSAATESSAEEASTGESSEEGGEVAADVSYTYHTYSSSLANNWNPHTWETNADSGVLDYITSPFVDMSISDSENMVYQWVYEMATEVNDVTANHQDDLEKYAVVLPEGQDAASTTEGYVYEIKLNENAAWANGEKINADNYIYSMQQLLAPDMHNYRANNYITGESALAGGMGYYYSGQTAIVEAAGAFAMADLTAGEDGQYVTADGDKVYFAVAYPLEGQLGGNSLKDYVEVYGDAYFGMDTWEELLALVDENGLVPLTDETYALFAPVTTANPNWNESEADLPMYFVYSHEYPEVDFDTVGLYKVDDYTLIYVNQTQIDMNYFLSSLTGNTWLVYEELYENGKDTTGDLVTTDYGTSPENTMAYGPYMMETLQADKQMVFVQNPNWYGWEKGEDGTLVSYTNFEVDGETKQQYRTTKIVIDVMDDASAKQAFLKGELSSWSPSADELTTYSTSDKLYQVDETYTQRFFFHTNLDDLKAMDESKGNTNSVVLSNYNFRKAFSLSIDRSEFVTATAGYKAAYSMLNSLYYYDVYDNPESIYRNSDEAMQAICNVYGVEYGEGKAYATLEEAYKSINGYNLEEAQALMKQACEELVAEGLYTAGDPIVIRVAYKKGSLETAEKNQETLMNKYINAAAEGSGFGSITLEFLGDIADRYGDTAAGEYAIGYGAWGGAAFYPFTMFKVYCDPDYASIHEAGCWDPSTTNLTLNVEGEEVTMTWQAWSNSMSGTGAYANADFSVKLSILSQIEENYLKLYYCIPLCATTACEMLSYQMDYYTEDYNIMYGFGGIRLMQYYYTDAEWTEYVSSVGGELNYE